MQEKLILFVEYSEPVKVQNNTKSIVNSLLDPFEAPQRTDFSVTFFSDSPFQFVIKKLSNDNFFCPK
jgi:hypothetical protein